MSTPMVSLALRGDRCKCHPLPIGRRRNVVKDGDVSVVRERPQNIVTAGRHLKYVHDPVRAGANG